ncbi:MAG: class I SAM-dependent methyltransferase [Nanoarchaeota archaeon]|nr:class I SAM-dependent methyltransferase [Nanoarchaeota archaeon]MBU1854418.1 class I SAM-dependent methyltransferase [Nanoarchaeota archaeon]
MSKDKNEKPKWWDNNGGFFGSQYIIGDDSTNGYLPNKQETLEERTQREVDGIIKLLDLIENPKIIPNNRRPLILDCPCGYGRHTIELLRKGYHTVGYDINDKHLFKAKQKLNTMLRETYPELKDLDALNLEGFFYKRDMRTLIDCKKWARKYDVIFSGAVSEKFDAVINMFYSFGFFETEEENKKVMEEFYKVLKEKGQLLIHTDVSPEIILQGKNYKLSEKRNIKNGGQLHIEESYNPNSKRISGSWTIIDSEGRTIQLTPYSVRIYSADEFKSMALNVGFSKVDIYGSFNGDSFAPNSNEMIVVAKKK